MLGVPPDAARVRDRLRQRFDADVCARGYADAFDGNPAPADEAVTR